VRPLILSLLVVLAGLQWALWFGRGGRGDVREIREQIEQQRAFNTEFEARNRGLAAEVMDLKQGLDAVEELARSEMGMIRQDEIFFEMLEPPGVMRAAPVAQ